MHLEWDLPNPLQHNFRLSSLLRGARRHLGDYQRQKRPITPELMKVIYTQLNLTTPLDANVWAICLCMFYGLLRKASVLPNTPHDTSNRALCRKDVRFHTWGVTLIIRATKTIQFQERCLEIPLPRVTTAMWCPVSALLNAFRYTATAPDTSPAFLLPGVQTGHIVTGRMFDLRVRRCLAAAGLEAANITPHSWRRGGAQFAYAVGLNAETIRMLGDWRSSAYLRYLDTHQPQLRHAITCMQRHITNY